MIWLQIKGPAHLSALDSSPTSKCPCSVRREIPQKVRFKKKKYRYSSFVKSIQYLRKFQNFCKGKSVYYSEIMGQKRSSKWKTTD